MAKPLAAVWQVWLIAAIFLAAGVAWSIIFWPYIKRAVVTGTWEGRGAFYDRRTNPGMYWLGLMFAIGIAMFMVGISVWTLMTLIFHGWPTSLDPNAPRARW
jgi:hypothetical protein